MAGRHIRARRDDGGARRGLRRGGHARRRRALLAAGGAAAGVPLAGWLPAVSILSARARTLLDVRVDVARSDAVGLTFDDGPHPQGTPAVLRMLAEKEARATFFLVGEQVRRRPALAREIRDAGHEIAIHCERHRNLLRVPPWQLRDDLDRAQDAIHAACGVAPARYRPPYGILTAPAVREARRRGWEVVLWRSDGRDWSAKATPESICERLLARVGGGEVLLLHDADYYSAPRSWERTAGALGSILARLSAAGIEAESLAAAGGTAAPE